MCTYFEKCLCKAFPPPLGKVITQIKDNKKQIFLPQLSATNAFCDCVATQRRCHIQTVLILMELHQRIRPHSPGDPYVSLLDCFSLSVMQTGVMHRFPYASITKYHAVTLPDVSSVHTQNAFVKLSFFKCLNNVIPAFVFQLCSIKKLAWP